MNTIQFFEDEHQKAERFLNTLESCEIDEKTVRIPLYVTLDGHIRVNK